MAEALHRKCTRTEWVDATSAAAAAGASPVAGGGSHSLKSSPTVNNVVSAAFGAIEKRAYLIGGVNPRTGKSLTQSLEFDMTTKVWSNLGAWFPVPISDAPMVSCGSTLVLFGGWDDAAVMGDLWLVHNKVEEGGAVATGQWRRFPVGSGTGPSARRGHSMVASALRDDGSFTVYVFGGFDGSRRLNDLWALEVTLSTENGAVTPGGSWTQLPSVGETPNARDACAFALDQQKQRLIVFGGFTVAVDQGYYTYDLPATARDTVSPSPAAPAVTTTPTGDAHPPSATPDSGSSIFQWTKRTFHVIPSRRQHIFGVCSHQYLLVLFGHDGKQTLSQICQLHMGEGKWSLAAFDGDEVEPRLTPSVCLAEGGKKVLIFGGQGPKGKYFSSLLELELEKCETVAPVKGKK
jgi:hypothetical protein